MVCSLQFMRENWKVIPDYPKYSVSDLGRVKRYHILKPRYKLGYIEAILSDAPRKPKYKLVHILVLETFKPNPRPGFYTEVDHINRVRRDNRLCNLRWSNRTLNLLNTNAKGYSYHTGSKKYCARIKVLGVCTALGCYKKSEHARRAYVNAKKIALQILDPDQKYEVLNNIIQK